MNIEILGRGTFESALVHLEPGDEFISEAGAMFRASTNVDITVTTSSGDQKSGFLGKMMRGAARMLAGESFFLSKYEVTDDENGEVGIAPPHAGQLKVVELDGETAWLCAGGSYLGSEASLTVDTKFQGLKGMFTGAPISFSHVTGEGKMIVGAFGRISLIEVEDEVTVDTGHVVAFEETLDYKIGKPGKSWITTWLVGEGLVMHFHGQGKLLVQSHNMKEFGKELGSHLRPVG